MAEVAQSVSVLAEPVVRLWLTCARGATSGIDDPACFRVWFVEAGSASVCVEGQWLELIAGDVCWRAPGQDHAVEARPGAAVWALAFAADAIEPTEVAPVLFAGPPRHAWLSPFVRAVQDRRVRTALTPAQHGAWCARMHELERELTAQPLGHAMAARALLMLVLIELARQLVDDQAPLAIAPPRSPLVEAALRYVEEHFRRPIGLRDVARAVARSPAYLTDLVRRETGKPIGVWLLERRLAEARHLLLSSDLSTEQVAASAGFGDPRHFARQFRRENGLPPQAWRAAQRIAGWEPTPPKEPRRRSKPAPL